MKINYFFIYLFIVSCSKERTDIEIIKESRCECTKKIDLGCIENDLFNDYYFKATINNKSFCIKSSKYSNSNGVGLIFRPLSPLELLDPINSRIQNSFYQLSFIPPVKDVNNGLYEELAPIIHIQTPYIIDSIIRTPQFYLDKFFNKGEYELAGETSDRTTTYLFNITWACVLNPGYAYYKKKDPYRIPTVGVGLSTLPGNQKKSKFIIQKSQLIEESGNLFLELEIEIECDLYFDSIFESYKYYGRLVDGVYKTRVKYQ